MADKVIINPEGPRGGLWVEDETTNPVTFTTSLVVAKRWDETEVDAVVDDLNNTYQLHLYSGNPTSPPPPPPGV